MNCTPKSAQMAFLFIFRKQSDAATQEVCRLRREKFMNKKKLLCIASSFLFLLYSSCSGGGEVGESQKENGKYEQASKNLYEATLNSLVATDAMGRSFGETSLSATKNVGMFYFVWHGEHNSNIYDITELSARDPQSLWSAEPNTVSPLGEPHYWGEPLYGYYASDDPWVLKRHLELLTMSGVDYLALDLTNISLYEKNVRALLDKVVEFQQQGWNPPKICALLSGAANDAPDDVGRITEFYNLFYKDSKYDDVWYTCPDGKPLIGIGMKWAYDRLSDEIKNAFHFRNIVWPFQAPSSYPNDMSWMDWEYPQRVYDMDGFMNVSVAQHNSYSFSKSINPETADASYDENRGRGWSYTSERNIANNVVRGTNFQSQWDTAFQNYNNVNEVMVTGWNEWIAFKALGTNYYKEEANDLGRVCFPDTANMEFSRDLEMMKGGYGDNFYLQNMLNTRKFKSNGATVAYAGAKGSPELSGAFAGARTYLDIAGDAMPRNFRRADGKETYVNDTNRNDIVKTEVMNDTQYLYIRVTTKDDIVIDENATNNLNILLSVQGKNGSGWEGYSFIVNRKAAPFGAGTSSLEKFASNGKFEFSSSSTVDSYMQGNVFAVRIPLSALGVKGNFTVDFKVADGISDCSNIDNYYIDGDCAPIGRLNYRYNAA